MVDEAFLPPEAGLGSEIESLPLSLRSLRGPGRIGISAVSSSGKGCADAGTAGAENEAGASDEAPIEAIAVEADVGMGLDKLVEAEDAPETIAAQLVRSVEERGRGGEGIGAPGVMRVTGAAGLRGPSGLIKTGFIPNPVKR